MDELIKLLDENLQYVRHEIIEDTIYIYVISERNEVICPFCGTPSAKTHSHYKRSFQDLPLQGKKVVVVLSNRKMFCNNSNCNHTTFAEPFDFLQHKAKKTDRLKEEIISVALNQSSVSAAEYLGNSVADVKKSTICDYLKKMRTNNR
jgi:transposase